ncbi:DUF1287 domain-containing protein [Aliikangiella marina]|uniref:DUF1287 domain-containing protein n=1 Tax=Aliikangiella marina TaxID=1712262 RepID=A0A545T744_9GAMM|nr:DUF1287 domain-containing protein [Aliikangiella marina]TQV73008.1 DUF1287 domain-containing protein [Aliikangiella marina]
MVRFLLLVVLASAYSSCVAYESTSAQSWSQRLVDAAHKRLQSNVTYSGAYYAIEYPNGDVPANIGVCTDVVIRSFRELGVDLQQLVHEDMSAHFSKYPNLWGLKRPDPNIDHRRVPNLQVFFERNGTVRNISNDPRDYQPGDIVTWMLPGNLPHIGIVSNKKSPDGARYLIVHNIGAGPKLEDFLFDARITGHYQFKNN